MATLFAVKFIGGVMVIEDDLSSWKSESASFLIKTDKNRAELAVSP